MTANYETEEAYVCRTFREFVRLWGNGSQAHLQVQCYRGQAWVQLMSSLGHSSSPHLARHDDHHHGYYTDHDFYGPHHHHGFHGPHHHHGFHGPHHHHGFHGPHPGQHKRRKGAKQIERDRVRAALYRASRVKAAEAAAAAPASAPAPGTLYQNQLLLPSSSPLHCCREDLSRTPQNQISTHPVEEVALHHYPPHLAEEVGHHHPSQAHHQQDDDYVRSYPPRQAATLRILPRHASPTPSYSTPGGWGAKDPTRAESDVEYDSEVESALDNDDHPAQVGGGPQQAPAHPPCHGEREDRSSLTLLLPSYGADLSSFSFSSSQHPPISSPGRPFSNLQERNSLSEIRKPVKLLKCSLSQNIDRAFRVNSDQAGGGRWVWEVCVKRDFVRNMVWDKTSVHGFSYDEEYEEYVNEDKSDEHFKLDK